MDYMGGRPKIPASCPVLQLDLSKGGFKQLKMNKMGMCYRSKKERLSFISTFKKKRKEKKKGGKQVECKETTERGIVKERKKKGSCSFTPPTPCSSV
jgi:hypothetical protein